MATKEKVSLITLLFLALTLPFAANAVSLKTEVFSLQLPQNWSCEPNDGLFVCTDQKAPRQKPGVIIFQYDEAGPGDTIAKFREDLKKPRAIKGAQGVPLLSRIISMEDKNIAGQIWFEALHFEGELQEYYTYYLATRRGDLQFLMTLTGHKSEWERYRPMFESTINSVQLFTPTTSSNSKIQNPASFNAPAGLPQPGGAAGGAAPTLGERFPKMLDGMGRNQWMLIGAVLVSALMILYALKKD